MEELTARLKLAAMEYLQYDEQLKDEVVPDLVVNFSIEQFKLNRNYPKSFSDDDIMQDLNKHESTLTMMVVDCFTHYGAEGETAHDEKNIKRQYQSPYISKQLIDSIIPFVDILF